jgi:1,4-alpha-glucan branching enzyme
VDAERGQDAARAEVAFRLPAGIHAETVAVAGDFNDWSPSANPLERGEDGSWSTTVRLPAGRHRFRYVIDGHRWENDWAADDYESNELGEDNSVKIVPDVPDVPSADARAIGEKTFADSKRPADDRRLGQG